MDDNWRHFEEKDRMIEDDLRKNVDDMRHQFDEKDRMIEDNLNQRTTDLQTNFDATLIFRIEGEDIYL